jgi:hypothetical protein
MTELYSGTATRSNDCARVVYGIASSRSREQRCRHWYHVARLAKVDGTWYEVYWVPAVQVSNDWSKKAVRANACAAGVPVERGVFYTALNRRGSCMIWSED